MTEKETKHDEFTKEFKVLGDLENLLGRVEYCILGQEPQMRGELERLKAGIAKKLDEQRLKLKKLASEAKSLV